MRTTPELRRFKIVLVTDRTQLQEQMAETASLTGEVVRVAKTSAAVKDALGEGRLGLGLRHDSEISRARR